MSKQQTALVLGAGGFIGSHMVRQLKSEGYWVRGVDLKEPEFSETLADDFIIGDLTDSKVCSRAFNIYPINDGHVDEIYQFAALMGGAGYIFVGHNDAQIVTMSALINLNVAIETRRFVTSPTLFFASSACVYPQQIQSDTDNPGLKESDAYPSNPDSGYGKEKLFSEDVYEAHHRNFGLDIRVGRFHNIFGPEGTYTGGKEKAPAAICRKIAEAKTGDTIQVWGDGQQTRSFLFINDAIEGVRRLMRSQYKKPVNIGSDEMVSINQLVKMVCEISGKQHLFVKHIEGPQGVRGRNSDNTLIQEVLGWKPSRPLREGMEKLFWWINEQIIFQNERKIKN